jgi:hypothetical protein
MLASIVDSGALLQVVGLSFAATLLVVGCFTAGTVLTARGRGASTALGSLAYVACGAAVVLGLVVMFTTK